VQQAQQFGKMAGLVLNSRSVFQINFSVKLKVSALKTATSPSFKTFCAILLETDQLEFKKLNNLHYLI
jgi:hypothetical protein